MRNIRTDTLLGYIWRALSWGTEMNLQLQFFPSDLTRPILDVLYNPRRAMARRRKTVCQCCGSTDNNRSGCPSHDKSAQTDLWGIPLLSK